MKKIIAIVMAIAFATTFFTTVYAKTTDATVTVPPVKGIYKAGVEIAIPITISQWSNAYATIELDLMYNGEYLKLQSIDSSDTDFIGAISSVEQNNFMLICSPSSEKQAQNVDGGKICVAYFEAVKDIDKSLAVTVTAKISGYVAGKNDGWVSYRELSVGVISGGIYVDGTEPDVIKPENTNPTPTAPGTPSTGDSSDVAVAGVVCLFAATAFVLTKKRG